MREVTVYTVAKAVQGYRGDFVEIHSMPWHAQAPLPVFNADKPEVFAPRERMDRLPVHALRDPDTGEEQLVAMEPRLAQWLRAAAEADLRNEIARWNRKFVVERANYDQAMGRILDFRAAPWYLRLWRALRAEI